RQPRRGSGPPASVPAGLPGGGAGDRDRQRHVRHRALGGLGVIMRIATALYHQQSIDSISRRNEAMARLQEQISTGKRINKASDDPVGAAEAERIRASSAQMALEQRMMSFASGMLSQADGALGNASDALQSARELLISAGNST